jgi:hypothetical protein
LNSGVFRKDNNEPVNPSFSMGFTQSYSHVERVLLSEVNIVNSELINRSIPYSENTFERYKCRALWDTGANNSVITQKIVKALNLPTRGMADIHTAGGVIVGTRHIIDLWLPNKVVINNLRVLTGFLGDEADVLIGMDVITLGSFCISNYQMKTTFSFGMPSLEVIDLQSPRVVTAKNGIGRNSPCPCGSGEKYKRCHGRHIRGD